MIFVPTRGRRALLEEFFSVSAPSLPGYVVIDDDDRSYDGMTLPEGWLWLIGPRAPLVQIVNRAFRAFPDERFYAVVGDDMRFERPSWDRALAEEAGAANIAWGDDGVKGARLCACAFIGGELVRRMGWLAHPAFGHLYADTVWHSIANATGRARYRPDIRFRHLRVEDRTFAERSIAGDKAIFEQLKKSGGLERLALQARAC